MRTTLKVDDDVLAAARCLAAAEGTSLGAALSALARKGMNGHTASPATRTHEARIGVIDLLEDRWVGGFHLTIGADSFPLITAPPGFPKIDDEFVYAALEDFP